MIATDFICTYKELSQDQEASDELWRQQFLQVVGCENKYDDIVICDAMKEARNLILQSKFGEKFLETIWENGLSHPLSVFITRKERDFSNDLLLIQAYFGWATMDLLHRALIKLKQMNEVEWQEWQRIIDTYEKYKK